MMCPQCGRLLLAIFHEWNGTADTVTFEYLHAPGSRPCIVVLPYSVGMVRHQQEWVEMYGEPRS
jgi:hypothetical protein